MNADFDAMADNSWCQFCGKRPSTPHDINCQEYVAPVVDDEWTEFLHRHYFGTKIRCAEGFGICGAVTSDGYLVVDGVNWRAYVRPELPHA